MCNAVSLVWISARSTGALLDSPSLLHPSALAALLHDANTTDQALNASDYNATDALLAPPANPVVAVDDGQSTRVPAFLLGIVSGLAPLIYTLMGGARALRGAHAVEGVAMVVLIVLAVGALPLPAFGDGADCWSCRVSLWPEPGSLAFGADVLAARVLQGAFSLPWITPTLTDRLFLSEPKRAVSAFLLGALMAFAYSFLGSLPGAFALATGAGGWGDALKTLGWVAGPARIRLLLLTRRDC